MNSSPPSAALRLRFEVEVDGTGPVPVATVYFDPVVLIRELDSIATLDIFLLVCFLMQSTESFQIGKVKAGEYKLWNLNNNCCNFNSNYP